jgi:hypothetical protein
MFDADTGLIKLLMDVDVSVVNSVLVNFPSLFRSAFGLADNFAASVTGEHDVQEPIAIF